MDEPRGGEQSGTQGAGRPPAQPRLANLVVVAGAVVLIGLVAFALYRKSHTGAPGAAPEPSATPAQAGTENPAQGTPISAPLPVRLSPEASIIAERYRCVCSCNDLLNVCTCSKTPGSRDMRLYVQELVNAKKTGQEIDAAMVGRYGSGVLVATATPTPTPSPSPTRARKKRTR
ncbi:MAG TPA: cytochrome c-type biogenesis protein CcmH [Candidatus Dormibacteraeota bacterium]|nr:cytochrome c-type biogenesis protein CcmH [Candidatus Dormibacteraeota bacterium]